MKKENTKVIENEAMEAMADNQENQETEEVMPKKGFFTKIGEGIDKGVKHVAPVAKKVGKGLAVVGVGVAAFAAGAKLKGGKSEVEAAGYDESEAEDYDTKYAIEGEYTE